MRKTLILIAVLIFSLCFSACESVSAHSPPETSKKFQVPSAELTAAAVADVSQETPYIPQRDAVQPAKAVFRDSALENQITVELSPTERSNQFSIVKPDENYQKGTEHSQPPERFLGFGSDNNARAKI